MNKNLGAIKSIAEALKEINSEVVFVGGATVELYIDDEAAPTPQPSEDVDCVVELFTYSEWLEFEDRLRAKGFADFDITEQDTDVPTCRKYILGMKVDFMPIEEEVLGYSNKWFKEGIESAINVEIENTEVRIFTLEHFLAAKFQAFFERGKTGDIRFSQDLEDLTELFDGATKIEEKIAGSSDEVKEYIQSSIKELIKDKKTIEEAMYGFLGYDDIGLKQKRLERIFSLFSKIITSED